MADTCGAKTRSGGVCQRAPLKGKSRCKLHGGASTGAPKGNRNAVKFGIYSAYLTEEELALGDEIALGDVEKELHLTRIRLRRALAAEQAAQNEPELDERIARDVSDKVGARSEEKYKRRDYVGIIDRLTARIESLEKTRKELLKSDELPTDALDGFVFTVKRASKDAS